MNYKQPCRFCNTLIDHNYYYCPFCGRAQPCPDTTTADDGVTKVRQEPPKTPGKSTDTNNSNSNQ